MPAGESRRAWHVRPASNAPAALQRIAPNPPPSAAPEAQSMIDSAQVQLPTQTGRFTGLSVYSASRSAPPISPMTPRRNASTQITKITPCVTVTHWPNCAR